VLGADRAPGLGCRILDDDAAVGRFLGRAQRRQPAVGEPATALERGGYRSAEPHLERLLHRYRRELDVAEAADGAVVAHRLARPQTAQQWQRLVDERAALLGWDADRVALRLVREPGHQRHQQSPSAEHVEARELLRQPHDVASG